MLGQAEADMAAAAEATPGDMQPPVADAQTALAELAAKIELLESQLTQVRGSASRCHPSVAGGKESLFD